VIPTTRLDNRRSGFGVLSPGSDHWFVPWRRALRAASRGGVAYRSVRRGCQAQDQRQPQN